jgi:His/Glu/Gln/Arg/opine family amino acid ABC transporter permease subunit
MAPQPAPAGLFTTIKLSFWGALVAAVVGLVMGVLRVSHRLFFKLTTRTYVELIRNTPPLVLVILFYYFVSDQILPVLGVDDFVRSLSPSSQQWLALVSAPAQPFWPISLRGDHGRSFSKRLCHRDCPGRYRSGGSRPVGCVPGHRAEPLLQLRLVIVPQACA